MVDAWRAQVRAARLERGLSQRELGELASVAKDTVRAYETGRRMPERAHLVRVLDALKLDAGRRNSIFNGVGLPNDAFLLMANNPDFYFTVEEASVEVRSHPWPAFVNNEWSEVLVANDVARQLWGVDLRTEYTDPIDRNLLSVASTPRFAERLVNWDEAIGVLVAVWKGHHRGPEDLEEPSPYFAAVMERFLNGEPQYVGRFLDLWRTVEPRTPKVRWWYPIVWNDPDVGVLRFRGFAGNADEVNGLTFNDWIPLDADTWRGLDAIKKRDQTLSD